MTKISLRSKALVSGEFHPFTYSIGLDGNLIESLHCVKDYPLKDPQNDIEVGEFVKSLTLFHEGFHFQQHLTTSFGLSLLRVMNICLRYLTEKPGWKLPIIPILNRKAIIDQDIDPYEAEALVRYMTYADQIFQYSIAKTISKSTELISPSITYYPHHTYFLNKPIGMSDHEYASIIKNSGGNVRNIPIFEASISQDEVLKMPITAATLMECSAFLCEVNHIGNAFGVVNKSAGTLKDWNRFDPSMYNRDINYLMPIHLAASRGIGVSEVFRLQTLIDLSLMYNPFILYNSSIPDLPKAADIPEFLYPGEIFVKALDHVEKIPTITEGTEDNVADFYNALCEEMNLPSPQWMADKAFDVVDKLLEQVSKEHTLLYKAFKAHQKALKERKEYGPKWPFWMVNSNMLINSLQNNMEILTFYDINTREPTIFNPENIDIVSTHNLIVYSLLGNFLNDLQFDLLSLDPNTLQNEHLACPLKNGDPFFCSSSSDPWNKLCVYKKDGKNVSECMVDIFEKVWKLSPPY